MLVAITKSTKNLISLYLLGFLLLLSCHGEAKKNTSTNLLSKEKQYSYEIYSMLLNTHDYLNGGAVFPAPPITYTKDFTAADFWQQIDSLKATYKDSILKIAISPMLFNTMGIHRYDNHVKDEYKNLFQKLDTLKEKPIDPSLLKINPKKITVTLLDTLRGTQKWRDRFKLNHVIIAYSRIAFSPNLDRVLLIESITKTQQDGISSTIYLKRENGKWVGSSPLSPSEKVIYETIKKRGKEN